MAQWIPQTVPDEVTMLLSMDFAGTSGIACGYAAPAFAFTGYAIATTNGGITWVLGSVPDSARSLTSVELFGSGAALAFGAYNIPSPGNRPAHVTPMHDPKFPGGTKRHLARIGMTAGADYKAMFIRSTDSGLTWSAQLSLPDDLSYVISSSFVSPVLGYVTADASPAFGIARVLKTTDGGENWTALQTPDSIVLLRNIAFTNATHGVAVGYRMDAGGFAGTIIRTTDGGGTWYSSGFPGVDNFTDVSFPSPLVGYIAGVDGLSGTGVVCKTTDGGETWNLLPYAPSEAILEGVEFAQGSTSAGVLHGLREVNGEAKPFYARTTDGGQTWTDTIIAGLPDDTDLTDAFFLDPAEGYLSGGNLQEAAMLFTDNGGMTSVGGDPGLPHRPLLLHQNFPNPFNAGTRLRFEVERAGIVSLRIFSIVGKEVATLVNGVLPPGAYDVALDAGSLATGVYFYRLESAGGIHTRTMILLK